MFSGNIFTVTTELGTFQISIDTIRNKLNTGIPLTNEEQSYYAYVVKNSSTTEPNMFTPVFGAQTQINPVWIAGGIGLGIIILTKLIGR